MLVHVLHALKNTPRSLHGIDLLGSIAAVFRRKERRTFTASKRGDVLRSFFSRLSLDSALPCAANWVAAAFLYSALSPAALAQPFESERERRASMPSDAAPQVNVGVSAPPAIPTITNASSRTQTVPVERVSSAQPALAPLERNDFQEFVLQSTGQDLPLFGSDLFRNVPTTFAPLDNVPVTPDYVFGPGDEILIRAWGNVDIDYRTAIDRNGSISLPRVGVINVAGIKYADLSRFLHTQVGRVFKNFELTATLGQLRSIQVFVVGQVQRPGNFTVSSLATMVNAVFAAGGPTSRGSMRGIQLRRADKLITELDLYDLVLAGDKSRDVQLLPGDVIFVPPIGAQVAVAGAVNTPAVFEIKKGASVSEALQWAGGLATTAQARRATLERIEERRARRVEELALDSAGLARPLRDGDLLTVFSLVPRFENAVTLARQRGAAGALSLARWLASERCNPGA